MSWLLALTANSHRDPKKGRTFHPDDFNPFAAPRPQGVRITKQTIGLLKVFLKPPKPRS